MVERVKGKKTKKKGDKIKRRRKKNKKGEIE
jgi:hypothetical protein